MYWLLHHLVKIYLVGMARDILATKSDSFESHHSLNLSVSGGKQKTLTGAEVGELSRHGCLVILIKFMNTGHRSEAQKKTVRYFES